MNSSKSPINQSFSWKHRQLILFFLLLNNVFLSGLTAQAGLQFKSHTKSQNKFTQSSFSKGVVVSQNKLASQAGAAILSAGGNAADAAFTTAYALAVVEPNGSGLGGGGFALVYTKKNNKLEAIDFRERAPAKVNDQGYEFVDGPKASGVPGTVKGLEFLQKKYGVLKPGVLLRTPYKLAAEGFPINNTLANAIARKQEVLSRFTESKETFLPGNVAPKAGTIIKQANLAATLKQIQNQGAQAFYQGQLAESLAQEMTKAGGIISLKDLQNYQVALLEPVCGSYRNKFKVCSFPLPSSGGVCMLEALNILENFDLPNLDLQSPERIHLVIEALKFSFADRSSKLGDPKYNLIETAPLLSKERGKYIAQLITERKEAIPSKEINGLLNKTPQPRPARRTNEREETTHFTVVDKEGNIVVITTSLNGALGSGFVVPGTGIMMNNTLDDFSIANTSNQYGLVGSDLNAPMAGKTPLSSMSPSIVFDETNNPILALGSPGGPTIISAVLNTMLAYLDGGRDLQKAVRNGRVHHQWMPDLVFAERELIDQESQKILTKKYKYSFPGKDNTTWKRFYWSVQAAELNWASKKIIGVSDPRTEEGLAYQK